MAGTAPTGGIIAVDAMGSDLGPSEVVAAVRLALEGEGAVENIVVVGDRAILEPLLSTAGLTGNPRVSIFHASEVDEMDDKPMVALKRKKDSSMVRAIELVKAGQAHAVFSCGNTGALMACATLKLRPLEGADRPALAASIPHKTGRFLLVDAGANPEADPEHLLHNAILGSNYCKAVLGIPAPRVGLLTIGTEEGKGTKRITETHDLLKLAGDVVRYSGPIEGFQVFANHVDVVVCDGFTGNVLIKTCESLVDMFKDVLKDELRKNPVRMAGAVLSTGAFRAVKRRFSAENSGGGAPLLGLNGYVLKAHGSSNRLAMASAIRSAGELIKCDMNHMNVADLALAHERIAAAAVPPAPAAESGAPIPQQ
jgi:glycerol-3-phosphate acyltransferase PlsX